MDPGRRLDAASTALVTDSSADVPPERRPANWRVVPIPVAFGDESFLDGVDIDAAGFYERLERSDRLPTTAQPSVAAIAAVLGGALETHETAVVLPLSGHMSGTVEAARAAAREVGEDRVLVLESGSVCVGLGLLALRLQERLERGCTAGEAAAAIERLSADHRCVFSLATLEYLQRGGRIGRAQAAPGSLLHVRPVLQIEDGEVAPATRVRGAHRVLPAIQEFLERHSDAGRPLRVAYGHARRPEAIPTLVAMVERCRPGAIRRDGRGGRAHRRHPRRSGGVRGGVRPRSARRRGRLTARPASVAARWTWPSGSSSRGCCCGAAAAKLRDRRALLAAVGDHGVPPGAAARRRQARSSPPSGPRRAGAGARHGARRGRRRRGARAWCSPASLRADAPARPPARALRLLRRHARAPAGAAARPRAGAGRARRGGRGGRARPRRRRARRARRRRPSPSWRSRWWSLTVLVLALFRQVGVLEARLGPRAALELAERGPAPRAARRPAAAPLGSAAAPSWWPSSSPGCRLCAELEPALRALRATACPSTR